MDSASCDYAQDDTRRMTAIFFVIFVFFVVKKLFSAPPRETKPNKNNIRSAAPTFFLAFYTVLS
jgi:hypothetical protein